ncbi:MAG: carbohydrate ABC transporter permease [Treponema sp.]|nr:carbohydrate ABC transporter permease [Treponema sp.]
MSDIIYNEDRTANWGKISRNYHKKKKALEIIYKICRAILLFGLCFLIIQPLLDKISVSFMAEQDLYDSTVISIPRNFTMDNYKLAASREVLKYFPIIEKVDKNQDDFYYDDFYYEPVQERGLFQTLFGYGMDEGEKRGLWAFIQKLFGVDIQIGSLLQTILIVIISSILQIAACTLAAYGFARYKFPLKNFWFFCVMIIIVIPPQTIMASLYLNFHFFDIFGLFRLFTGEPINLLNSVWGLWLLSATGMGLKSGLYIFMLRQYFRGMPKELEEAAWVDGCGKFKTFIRIMLPDATPMLVSCFLFSFVWQWTDSFFSTLFLTNYDMLARRLGSIAERVGQYWAAVNAGTGAGVASAVPIGYVHAMMATGMLLCLLPLIILYLIAQKAFVESLSQTGIKM